VFLLSLSHHAAVHFGEPEVETRERTEQGGCGHRQVEVTPTPMMAFSQPMGDAVVPGGAAHSPDLETLKNYLLLREHDVAALAAQLRTARLEVSTLRESLDKEQSRAMDFESQIKQQQYPQLDSALND
jgi:hypothetical protein